jgi:hypothetical protein
MRALSRVEKQPRQKEKDTTFENSMRSSNFFRFLREAQTGSILLQGIGVKRGKSKAL